MAATLTNLRSVNSWFVQVSSAASDTNSYINTGNLKLVAIIYTMSATTDSITINDLSTATAATAGVQKFLIKGSTAGNTSQLRLENSPVVFANGAWVTLTGSPTATLIFQNVGSGS